MNDEEYANDDPCPERNTGSERCVIGCLVHLVFLYTNTPIRNAKPDPDYSVKQEAGKEDDFHWPEQWIRCHEFGIDIEGRTAVLFEQEQVNIEMNEEEGEQEEAGQGHDDLPAHWRIQ